MKNTIKIFVLTFFSLVLSYSTYAQKKAIGITITTAKGSPGDTVCVDFKVDSFINIQAAQFGFSWDNTKLDYVGITNYNGVINPAQFTINTSFTPTGKLGLLYENPIGNGTTLPNGSTVFSLCFRVKMAVGETDQICLSKVGNSDIEFSNNLAQIIDYKPKPPCGKIEAVLPILKPVKLIGTTEVVKQNDTACIAYTVDDFTKVTKLEYDLEWDVSKLKFESISMINPLFAPNGTNTPFYSFNPVTGTGKIFWSAALAGTNNLTLPNGTLLFKLCFKAIGPQGSICPVNCPTSPAPNVVTATSNNQNVGLSGTKGKINILKTDFDPVEVNIPNYTGDAGQNFCIDIKGSKIDSIIALQYTMQWDPEVLKFIEIKNIYPFAPTVNVTTSTTKAEDSGFYTLAIESPSSPLTLPANTVLYQVCFQPTGLLGCSDIKLTAIPTAIAAYNNQTQENIEINSNIGKICIQSAIKVTDTTFVMPNCKDPFGGSIGIKVGGGTAPYTYLWSPNANNATTPTVKPLAKGVYYVTITDASVPTKKVAVRFELNSDLKAPDAVAKALGIIECKANSKVVLDGKGSSKGTNYKYKWLSTNGVFEGSDSSITAVALSPEAYYLQVTNCDNGCIDTSNVVVLKAPDVPNIITTGNQFIACTNSIGVQLSACASTPAGNLTYKWSSATGTIDGTPNKCNPFAKTAGEYIVTVTNTANSCSAVEKTIVTADPNVPKALAIVKDTLNCDNASVQLYGDMSTTPGGVIKNFTWATGVGNNCFIQNEKNAIATVDCGGKYVLLVRNDANCVSIDTVEVIDCRSKTAVAKAQSKYNLDCKGKDLVIDASAGSSVGNDYIYSWKVDTLPPSLGGKIVKGKNTPIVTVNQQGIYIFTVKHKYSKCESVAKVTVLPPADQPAQVDAGKDTVLTCLTTQIQLNGKSDLNPDYKFKWTAADGSPVNNATSLVPIITKGGKYTLTVTNSKNGCEAVDSVTVTENKELPNAKIQGLKDLTCGSDPILLNGSGSQNADYYEWTARNGGKIKGGTEKTQTAVAETAGIYVLVTKRNDNGCTDSAKHTIKFSYPAKGLAGADTLLCTASPLTLTATIIPNGSGVWTTFGKAFIEEKTNNITEINSLEMGKNIFVWTSSAKGCPDFAADTMVVFVEKPINAKDDNTIQKNKSEFFSVPVTLNDNLKFTQSWILQAISKPEYGTLDTAATKTGFKYKPSDCYAGVQTFKYVVSSKNCPIYRDTAEVKISITGDPSACKDVVIPNTITPNGDGLNDGFRIDAIEFQPERFKEAELIVMNRWGDIVYKKRPYKNEWQGTNGDGNDLPQGTYYYILSLNLADGVVYRGDITILK